MGSNMTILSVFNEMESNMTILSTFNEMGSIHNNLIHI